MQGLKGERDRHSRPVPFCCVKKGGPMTKGYPPAYKKSLFSASWREKAGKTDYKDGLLLLLFKGCPVTSSLKRPQD